MTYLDEAYRRFKLPIRVTCENIGDDVWEWGFYAALDYFPWVYAVEQYDAKSATLQYLAVVKELSQ